MSHIIKSVNLGSNLFKSSRIIILSAAHSSTSTQKPENEKKFKLLIVGGGTGGSAIAGTFAKMLNKDIGVIEPSADHYYQSMFTLVGGGLKTFDQTSRHTKDILNNYCSWIQDKAVTFDPSNNLVITKKGDKIKYDFLLLALGLQLNYDAVKGLQEAIDGDANVCSIYSPKYVQKVLPAVKSLKEGVALYTFPSTPVKCAGAAQKICYLSEERLFKNSLRDKVIFKYYTALPVIFPVPRYAEALDKYAEGRLIDVKKNRNLVEVRGDKKEAVFKIVGEEDKYEVVKYSLLHVAPPMSTPSELWNTPLVDQANFVSVNPDTLQHTKYKNVFALGDCTSAPTSKTAAACASQIGVVSKNLKAAIMGQELKGKYDGYTSCPLTVSSSKVILAEFGYDGKILETFPFDQRVPRYSMFLLKVHLMPIIYWKLMVKGMWHGPSFFRKLWRFGL
ncbi:hypothetical protein HELRODRAFT_73394 [Helobdella robusta]|uniref:Sulfide:quinone oxidoreductase, mitochondrial n=1 Tax=Helobdella robusta TaxID=6412 RepID=T1G1D5_HELRO|nr:hypothetical protein HELRODRAFT_73394 [Helobdella robusta]ESO09357.1 hypothetical protein HELRODRAFT_73394 [Helobdella robusta]